jgi:hypothetical protein
MLYSRYGYRNVTFNLPKKYFLLYSSMLLICSGHHTDSLLSLPRSSFSCRNLEEQEKMKPDPIFIPAMLLLILPCIPNAKLANGLGLPPGVFKFSLKILKPPFGELLLVQRLNFDAAVHQWITTETAQFT